jgi:hypothetical protein
MRSVFVVMLMLLSACGASMRPPPPVPLDTVGYNVTRDAQVAGRYNASATYVEGQGVDPDTVKWHILRDGVAAARNDGYDLVVWSGPSSPDANASAAQRQGRGPVISYVVQGYKSAGRHPPSARPIGAVIDQINSEIEKQIP